MPGSIKLSSSHRFPHHKPLLSPDVLSCLLLSILRLDARRLSYTVWCRSLRILTAAEKSDVDTLYAKFQPDCFNNVEVKVTNLRTDFHGSHNFRQKRIPVLKVKEIRQKV